MEEKSLTRALTKKIKEGGEDKMHIANAILQLLVSIFAIVSQILAIFSDSDQYKNRHAKHKHARH